MDAWQQDQGLIQTGGGDRQPPEDSESDAAPQIVSQNLPTLPTPRPLPLAALLLVGFGILWMASPVASQSGHATASVAKMDGTPSVKHSLYEEEQSPCGTTQAPATQAPANPCSTTLAPASPCATTPKPGATGPGGAGPGGAGPGAPKSSKCGSNFVSKCHVDWLQGGLLLEVNLGNSDMCGVQCGLVSGCKFYAYKKNTVNFGGSLCQLFSTPMKEFLDHCMESGGASDGLGPGCADPEEDSCDMFRLGDCQFAGSPAERDLDDGGDETNCAKLASQNHHAGYIHKRESKKCDLYDQEQMEDWRRSCPVIYGPPGKKVEECGQLPAPISNRLPHSEPVMDSSDLSFGGCQVGKHPFEEADMPSMSDCAKFCFSMTKYGCKFYRFDHMNVQGRSCKLFDASFHDMVSNCNSAGGAVGSSISWPRKPTKVYHAECDYLGMINEISELGKEEATADTCNKLCKANEKNGNKGWVFTEHDKKCRLLSSPDRRCSVSFGPPLSGR